MVASESSTSSAAIHAPAAPAPAPAAPAGAGEEGGVQVVPTRQAQYTLPASVVLTGINTPKSGDIDGRWKLVYLGHVGMTISK